MRQSEFYSDNHYKTWRWREGDDEFRRGRKDGRKGLWVHLTLKIPPGEHKARPAA